MVDSHILKKSRALAGPIVLFEGSPSRLADFKAVIELKLISTAISQSNFLFKTKPFTDTLAHPTFLGLPEQN